MVIALVNARLLTPAEEIPPATVILGEGRIARGFDADLEALDEGLELVMTFVGGESAFCWPKGSAV